MENHLYTLTQDELNLKRMKSGIEIDCDKTKQLNVSVLEEEKKRKDLLIIYTGGTFGMDLNENGHLTIKGTASLANKLKEHNIFVDKEYTFLHGENEFFITQPFNNTRIFYKIHQYETLIDSSDTNIPFLLKLTKTIEQRYADFDAFLIIHGTDTMEYTASVLSFMIKGLNKMIILTGSQIPLAKTINDAYRNLLGSLRLIGTLNS